MSSKFTVGCVVSLNSGGPKMTVTKVVDQNSTEIEYEVEKKAWIHTTWFAGNKKESGVFPPETLIIVSEEPKK